MISKHIFANDSSLATAQALKIWGDENLISPSNPYLEDVSHLPEYDSGDTEHFIISSDADFLHINDEDKKHFFVEAGSYGSYNNVIEITASGTEYDRRTVQLYDPLNPNDTRHPGQMDLSELALWGFNMTNANFWTFDRHAYANGVATTHRTGLLTSSSDNIFNRSYGYKVEGFYDIWNYSHRNTFQKGRYEFPEQGLGDTSQSCTIQIRAWDTAFLQAFDNKIVSNEFKNSNDAVHFSRAKVDGNYPMQDVDLQGTIVYDNDFGLQDYSNRENAIDIQCASLSASNPMIIKKNRMWGYKAHPDYEDQGYYKVRQAIVAHFNPKNVQITENVFFDCNQGFSTASQLAVTGFSPGLEDGTFTDNLLYQCGQNDYDTSYGYGGLSMRSTRNVQAENNAFIDCKVGIPYARFANNDADSTFQLNDICAPTEDYNTGGTTSDGNAQAFVDTIANNTFPTSAINGGYTQDFVFTKDKYTNNPVVVTLTNCVKP